MSPTLIALATQVGAPLIRQILSRQLGPANGQLAERVLSAVADRAGVPQPELGRFALSRPSDLEAALVDVEASVPALLPLQMAEAETRAALLMADASKGGWHAWWRPGWMYLLGLLWIWQVIGLHVLNAVFKIALPAAPWEYLMGVTAVITGLYMGGHTIKDVAKTWKAGR